MMSRGESKTRCRASVSSTAPRFEPRCPPVSETAHDELADLGGEFVQLGEAQRFAGRGRMTRSSNIRRVTLLDRP